MKVTLHFPSAQLFRLWCKAFAILRDRHSNGTLHRNDKLLGLYRTAQDNHGILATINTGSPTHESDASALPL